MNDDNDEEDEDDDDNYKGSGNLARFYILCFVFSFIVLFSLFSLILWAASKPYKPKISMKSIVFENLIIQAGTDHTGVPTDMLTLNSTVRFVYRNPATFFGVHVSSTPVELHYYQLKLASGHMKEFYQSRKSERKVVTRVEAKVVPLYGGVSALGGIRPGNNKLDSVNVPLNLTFVVRSRAYVLGRLVKPKFYGRIRCSVTLKGNRLSKPLNLKDSCDYH